MLMASRSIVRKLRKGYSFRGEQADIVRKELDSCPYPKVICGTLTILPNSYTYFFM